MNIDKNEPKWSKDFQNFFIKQITSERLMTQQKIDLLLKVSKEQLFQYLISNSNTPLIKLSSILSKFPKFKEQDIIKIIRIYDKNNDSALNYEEFINFISPKYIDINIDAIRETKNKNSINDQCIKMLENIFILEINLLNESYLIISHIFTKYKDFNALSVFIYLIHEKNNNINQIKTKKLGILDLLNFINKNNNNVLYEQDIMNLIYRFDYDNDMKLSYSEFNFMINYFCDNTLSEYSYLKLNEINKIEESSFDKSSFLNNSITNLDIDDIPLSLMDNNNLDIIELRKIKINLLTEFFKVLINELNKIELSKNILANNNEILLPDIFSIFDYDNSGNISIHNLRYIFENYFNISFDEFNLKLLMYKFDKNKDDKLNYKEFCYMLLPAKIESAKKFANHKVNNEVFEGFNDKQRNDIICVFMNLIKCEEIILKFKIKLINTPLFSYYEYFEYLRNINTGVISGREILEFLDMNKLKIGENELNLIFNYFYFFSGKKDNYNFNDFIKIFKPYNGKEIYE